MNLDTAAPPVDEPALRAVSLEDRYDLDQREVLLSGSQALVRMLLLQRDIDRIAGRNTAGFVSGYRGSPLGGFDFALWKSSKSLKAADIVFQPGVNEDLAATAVWGTQQLQQLGPAKVDGVFAVWYGKGPGVDRSGDPIKHGNYSGTHPLGGVLAVFGDDHPGKSSTIAHHSEQAMAANNVPVLYPASAAEIVQHGLLGFALSRYSGCWASLKVVNETVEQTTAVTFDHDSFSCQSAQPRRSASTRRCALSRCVRPGPGRSDPDQSQAAAGASVRASQSDRSSFPGRPAGEVRHRYGRQGASGRDAGAGLSGY